MAFWRRDLVPPWGSPGGHRDRSPSTTVPWTQDLETPTGDGARFAASGEGICGCPPSTMISEEGIWHPPSSPQVGWHSPGGTRMALTPPSSTTILREDAGSPSSPAWEGCSWVWWWGGPFLRRVCSSASIYCAAGRLGVPSSVVSSAVKPLQTSSPPFLVIGNNLLLILHRVVPPKFSSFFIFWLNQSSLSSAGSLKLAQCCNIWVANTAGGGLHEKELLFELVKTKQKAIRQPL